MKLSTVSAIFAIGQADLKNGRNLSLSINRHMQGHWIDKVMSHRMRRAVDGEKGFRPLAAMIMYMQGQTVYDEDSHDPQDFENQLQALEDKYTSYGCYCWIQSTADGLVGGGMTKDVTDHHCKELYRCYKCVRNDYSQSYTDVDYYVEFTTKNGNRQLDCKGNAKQDAENICECDKRFAENIAATEKSCASNTPADPTYGDYCMDNQYKTATGGGSFDPSSQCKKPGAGDFHDGKDKCCGLYPNRYPYNSETTDCCRTSALDGNDNVLEIFSILNAASCREAGGEVVVSKKGDPHNYSVVE